MRYRYFEAACLLCILIGIATSARAAPEPDVAAEVTQTATQESTTALPDQCQETPWYCGVAKDQQQRALALYSEGNQFFDDSLFVGAVKKYRAALEHWDHPSIHYNLMLALVALERPIEAYESSLATLRHGPKALRPEEYQRARDYRKLLRGRIAILEVTCDEPDAVVSLDGKPLFRAPGTVQRYVLPGLHELVAKKPGYVTAHRTLLLASDEPLRVQVRMLPQEQAMLTTRRWKRWQPWAVVGAGLGVGLLGSTLQWRGDINNNAFGELFEMECSAPNGCFEPEYTARLQELQTRSTWYRRLGHGMSAAAAATAITGLVLVYLNRPHETENPARRDLIRVSVTPAVHPQSATLSMQVDF